MQQSDVGPRANIVSNRFKDPVQNRRSSNIELRSRSEPVSGIKYHALARWRRMEKVHSLFPSID